MTFFRGHDEAPFRRRLGFSLMDLLLALLVGAILLVSVEIRRAEVPGSTPADRARQDLTVIASALHQYRLDNQVYPTSAQGLRALVERPGGLPKAHHWRRQGYLDSLPQDPWGNPYQYRSPGLHGPFDVYSLGANGVEGGIGEDADIRHRPG